MERQELEVYSAATNHGVVRMPNRRFPGCVIQGDTLFNLVCLAQSILDEARRMQNEELVAGATDLAQALEERLHHYEQVLREHEIELPYVR